MSAALRLKSLLRQRLPGVVNYLVRVEDGLYRRRLGQQVFINIYERNAWGNVESRSGSGSTLEQTKTIRAAIPRLLRDLGVRSLLDIPCGDHHWMREVPLEGIEYIGMDIVPSMVERNQRLYGSGRKTFLKGNLVKDSLRKADLILCRDCFGHLPHRDIIESLRNIKRSGSTYILATTFTERTENAELNRFGWRPLNLQLSPFNLPPPIIILNENCTERDGQYSDKSLGLWQISDLAL
jgi:hypothetical protein